MDFPKKKKENGFPDANLLRSSFQCISTYIFQLETKKEQEEFGVFLFKHIYEALFAFISTPVPLQTLWWCVWISN